MLRVARIKIRIIKPVPLFLLLWLGGCATQPVPPPPAEPEPPVIVEEPPPEVVPEEPPAAEPVIEPPPVVVELPPSVAIVMTSRIPAYEMVAVELGGRFERSAIYDLSDKSQPAESAFRLINDSDTAAVIAIGLAAARSAVALSNVPVIFGQVFNYQDFDLITESSRGVAAIAPIEAQIDAWKESYPDVNRIGLIIGEGHDDLIAEATMAAERHAIQLNVQVTHSDQETLYFFKRMAPDIDGFWLLPDNRVLSARVIRDILEEADKRKVSALVSTESMLPLGAALSIETVPADIADRLVEIVLEIEAGRFGSVPAVTPLTEMRITIRDSAQHRSIAQADAIAAEDTLQ